MSNANPEAMILVMLGGDPACIDLEPCADGDRFERLLHLRNSIVGAQRDGDEISRDQSIGLLFDLLRTDFSEMPSREDVSQSRIIISGLLQNHREIEDLPGNVIEVIHDVCVNIGIINTLIKSYGVDFPEELLLPWMLRYRLFFGA